MADESWERVFHKHKAQVLWTVCTSACGKSFPKIVPMAKLHSLLACAFILSTYNNLLLKAKGRKKPHQIAVCNNLLWWNDAFQTRFSDSVLCNTLALMMYKIYKNFHLLMFLSTVVNNSPNQNENLKKLQS